MVTEDNKMIVLCRSDDESELAFFKRTVQRTDADADVRCYSSTEQLLSSIGNAELDKFRFSLFLSRNLSDCSANELVARIRGMSVLMPVVILRPDDNGSNSAEDAIPAGSVFSISASYGEAQLDRTMQFVVRLANQFFGLQRNTQRFQTLTPCETEIVRLATEGFPNKSIARKLDISIKTVEKYRRIAYTKLRVSSTAELASLVTFQHCWMGAAALG